MSQLMDTRTSIFNNREIEEEEERLQREKRQNKAQAKLIITVVQSAIRQAPATHPGQPWGTPGPKTQGEEKILQV